MRISDWSSDVCSSDLLEYLWTLSGMFLVLVCINGAFKYVINVYRGQLGERMLRRLRYELYSRVLRLPLGRFRRMRQGELLPMIPTEVDPLGGFVGDSISLPAFPVGFGSGVVGAGVSQ